MSTQISPFNPAPPLAYAKESTIFIDLPINYIFRPPFSYILHAPSTAINTAPAMPTAVESSKAYIDAAVIGLQIANYVGSLGYSARCHMDGNYLMPAIPIAVKAGLGERGRNSLLISRNHGCFVRIGMVTTDLELIPDEPSGLDTERFCKLCGRCIKTCPAKTIPASNDSADWFIVQEECYKRWRILGTDCGICISACPLGQDLAPENIKDMTDSEIEKYLDNYYKNHGSRKRNTGKVFI